MNDQETVTVRELYEHLQHIIEQGNGDVNTYSSVNYVYCPECEAELDELILAKAVRGVRIVNERVIGAPKGTVARKCILRLA